MDKTLETRLIKLEPLLKKQYYNVYEHNETNESYYEELLNVLQKAYAKRSTTLKAEDKAHPNWHLDRDVIGMMIYVDLFAKDFDGIIKRIPYLNELGITLVHLMPLLKPREGENDGGYAVEDFQDVDHARKIVGRWIELYNTQWLIERHRYQTPREVREAHQAQLAYAG